MPFSDLVLFILRGAAKSLSVELNDFFKSLSKPFMECSKQAISKSRLKLKPNAFISLNNALVEEYFKETYKTYKDYRLLGIDGSILQLPNGESINMEFGRINNNEKWVNGGRSVTIYDVLNDIIVDSELHESGSDERKCCIAQFKRIKAKEQQKKDLVIADRGFSSTELFMHLNSMQYDFVIRYSGTHFLRETKSFSKEKSLEKIVEINVLAPGQRKKNEDIPKLISKGFPRNIKLRLVKKRLQNGEFAYFATSVLDSNKLSKEDIAKIYDLRWRLEEKFKLLKNSGEIENFSGKTNESVKQDYYSRVLIFNLHSLVIQEAEKELEKESEEEIKSGDKKKLNIDYKVNRNVSYGMVRLAILDLLCTDKGDWESTYDNLVKGVKRHKIAVINGRSHPRTRKYVHKFPMNMRRAI